MDRVLLDRCDFLLALTDGAELLQFAARRNDKTVPSTCRE
jgi:hypothetical protein